jgi:hypothetical protein
MTEKYTPEQVQDALRSEGRRCGSCGQPTPGKVEWSDLFYAYGTGRTRETALGRVTVVHTDGGSEGDGEAAFLVIRTEETGQLFRVDGYYQSYDGLTIDGNLYEVQEKEKTVKVYE